MPIATIRWQDRTLSTVAPQALKTSSNAKQNAEERRRKLMRRPNSIFEDLWLGWRLNYIWRALAVEDVRQRYRRSVLGIGWIFISFALMVGTLFVIFAGTSPVYTRIEYTAYLATGLVTWNLIMTSITRGVMSFQSDSGWVKGSPAPLSVLAYKLMTFAVIEFAICAVIVVPVVVWAGLPSLLHIAIACAMLAFYVVLGVFAVLLFGAIGAWSSDFQQLVPAIMRIGFFATPIFWEYESQTGFRKILATYNPFTHFVEMVRSPLLGNFPTLTNMAVVAAISGLLVITALMAFKFAKPRLAAWV